MEHHLGHNISGLKNLHQIFDLINDIVRRLKVYKR